MSKLQAFIGVTLIMASAMNRSGAYEAGLLKAKDQPDTIGDGLDEGYHIIYKNGYESWCPKSEFEAKYFGIADKTKISKEDIDRFIVKGEGHKLGEKTCVVLDSTITGFDLAGTSACVDPNNYDQAIGEDIARKTIVNDMWGYLGFVLQWAKNGLSR